MKFSYVLAALVLTLSIASQVHADPCIRGLFRPSRNPREVLDTHKVISRDIGLSWEEIAKRGSDMLGETFSKEELWTVVTSLTENQSVQATKDFVESITEKDELVGHLTGVARAQRRALEVTGLTLNGLAKAVGNLLGRKVTVEQVYKSVTDMADVSIVDNWGNSDIINDLIKSWTKSEALQKIADGVKA